MHVTDIVVSWKLGSNCIVCIETGWCCVCGFRVNLLKFICTVCFVVCKHIRNIGSLCNKFMYYSRPRIMMVMKVSESLLLLRVRPRRSFLRIEEILLLVGNVAESKVWTASIFRNVILFWQSCCMCILGDQMLCLRYCFALCKINLFSVKPLWGFILVSSGTMYWLLSFSEKQYVFWLYFIIVDGNVRESELWVVSSVVSL